ncbi:alpha/beta hydrolase [Streptomyces sp. NRRL S-241]|uniref:alpha/beta hydrolase n=1 Tax=Streptomyces sp. NRRL S-241 TaxID=1463896 RepID=UPI000569B620|nr:dienelactone hydrolase family protein [Streptomyces sp. NRRL S-241]
MSETPDFVNAPFVLPVEPVAPERIGIIDLYLPEGATGPSPAVVFVCGGPLPAELPWNRPRDWPVYRGYGSLVAAHGAAAAPLQLPLHEYADFPRAAQALAQAIETLRADPRIDADRIAIWFFCGGGPLISGWLRETPEWLRCLAATYPVLGSRPGKELLPEFEPARALAEAGALPPIVLTTVGLEDPLIAETEARFVEVAQEQGVRIEVIDVPNGHHGFDFMDDTQESREAVLQALKSVIDSLK